MSRVVFDVTYSKPSPNPGWGPPLGTGMVFGLINKMLLCSNTGTR